MTSDWTRSTFFPAARFGSPSKKHSPITESGRCRRGICSAASATGSSATRNCSRRSVPQIRRRITGWIPCSSSPTRRFPALRRGSSIARLLATPCILNGTGRARLFRWKRGQLSRTRGRPAARSCRTCPLMLNAISPRGPLASIESASGESGPFSLPRPYLISRTRVAVARTSVRSKGPPLATVALYGQFPIFGPMIRAVEKPPVDVELKRRIQELIDYKGGGYNQENVADIIENALKLLSDVKDTGEGRGFKSHL